MSDYRWSGKYYPGAMRDRRRIKRQEAEARRTAGLEASDWFEAEGRWLDSLAERPEWDMGSAREADPYPLDPMDPQNRGDK